MRAVKAEEAPSLCTQPCVMQSFVAVMTWGGALGCAIHTSEHCGAQLVMPKCRSALNRYLQLLICSNRCQTRSWACAGAASSRVAIQLLSPASRLQRHWQHDVIFSFNIWRQLDTTTAAVVMVQHYAALQ